MKIDMTLLEKDGVSTIAELKAFQRSRFQHAGIKIRSHGRYRRAEPRVHQSKKVFSFVLE